MISNGNGVHRAVVVVVAETYFGSKGKEEKQLCLLLAIFNLHKVQYFFSFVVCIMF